MPDLQVAGAAGWLYNHLHMRKFSSLSRLQREMLATAVNAHRGRPLTGVGHGGRAPPNQG
jgi:hypothetical protein